MKKIIVLLIFCLLLTGCEKVIRETDYIYTEGETIRIPKPILRSYSDDGIKITFTDNNNTLEIESIYYNYADDQISVRCPAGNDGRDVRVYVRNAYGIINTTYAGVTTLTFVTGFMSTSNTVTEMRCTEDVLVISNLEHYIQFVVDGVVKEEYWLSDF